MWTFLLHQWLVKIVQSGTLSVAWPDTKVTHYGQGEPVIAIQLQDPATVRALVLRPELALGEAYTEGTLTIEQGDLRGLLGLAAANANTAKYGRFGHIAPRVARALRRFNQNNTPLRARRNVEHHYDLSTDMYEMFLDQDLQYTCAYYPTDSMTIEAAQEAKKALIARKLLLRPGMRVLDIGCGWGGMALTLARDYGVQVVGVTLSKVQLAYAQDRAKTAGLDHMIEFRLQDYRNVREEFDRIVVVGMLEHVGRPEFTTFFRKMQQTLKPDGVALLHTIGRSGPPNVTAPWIGKYIFPGCYTPAMSEVLTEVENRGLIITDIEVLRLHYARTIRAWSDKFEANASRIKPLYDDRFIRMWRYYLAASEIGFTHMGNVIFQFQITRDQSAVPLTRDYLWSGSSVWDNSNLHAAAPMAQHSTSVQRKRGSTSSA